MEPEISKEINEVANRVRGVILGQATYLEKMLEYYIATFYCGETPKRDHMIETFLTNDIGFKAKVVAFQRIVKHSENSAFLSKNPKIRENMNTVYRYRNCVAHEVADTSPDAIEFYKNTGAVLFTKLYSEKRTPFGEKDIPGIHQLFADISIPIVKTLPGFHVQPFPKSAGVDSDIQKWKGFSMGNYLCPLR